MKSGELPGSWSEEYLRSILETAVDGIIVIDEKGTVEVFNPASERIFGYVASEVVGQNVKMLMPSEYSEHHDEYIRNYLNTGNAKIIGIGREVTGKRKDGTLFPMDLAVSEMRVGAERRFTGLVRELTERKNLEERLLQSQKMDSIGRLAGGVAHDFNNLLTAIIGYCELATLKLDPSDPVVDDLFQVHRAAERAAGLTGQLLAFARKQIVSPQLLNLNAMTLNLEKMLRRLIGEHIELVTVPTRELWPVLADPSQMEQVLVNLCVNARDAMPEGGRITIETANVILDEEYAKSNPEVIPGEYVLLSVSDTGAGMEESLQRHIFEPFFTTKSDGKGTGLGLATCYGIVKQAGGHIWLYSEPNRGTIFKMYFPRAIGELAASDSPEAIPIRGGAETILLVEDERIVREFAVQALKGLGYHVLFAPNGTEAMRVAHDHGGPIHLLLTDVVMPQMSGKILAERLSRVRPELKVLYVSGYTENTIVHHGVLDEGIHFLPKPYSPRNLAAKIREILDRG